MKIVCTNKTKPVWELENGKWEGTMNEGRGRGGRWGQLRWTLLSFLFPPLLSFPFLFSLSLFFFLFFPLTFLSQRTILLTQTTKPRGEREYRKDKKEKEKKNQLLF